jgi:sterol desaturase/sphingolipid hydroxylase (fatty acid hydroxylase superfamily)
MTDWIIGHELGVRLIGFAGVLAAMAAWESLAPRRALVTPRVVRWANHLAISAMNALLVRALLPAAAVGVALAAERAGWGLCNTFAVPRPIALIGSMVALDLAIYLQHVLFHAVPVLWRLHRVHHADLDFDVTTGLRFHPLEILLSTAIKAAAIVALGAPATVVLIFEVLLNATSMFNHGNVRLAPAFERRLRRLVVTPEMHRVHHSIEARETNSNFGFNLPWWDRCFGTYRDQPDAGHERMTIGLADLRDARQVERLAGILWLPMRRPNRRPPIVRRRQP